MRAIAIAILLLAPPNAPTPRFDPPRTYDGQAASIEQPDDLIRAVEFWIHPTTVWSDDRQFLAIDGAAPFELPPATLDQIRCGPRLITAHFITHDGVWVGFLSAVMDGFPPCRTDLNDDCRVDTVDLQRVLTLWGTPLADVNGDGNTDVSDLLLVLSEWGHC